MRCEEARDQLAEHLLGTLDEVADVAVRRHLRGCAGCRREMTALAEGVSTLARAAHELDPPPALRGQVLAAIEEEWAERQPALPRRPLGRRLVAVAAALAVLASVGWGVAQERRASTFQAQAATYDQFLQVLGGENVRVGRLHPTGTQDLEGSVVLYDSKVGQSWALVLVRAPGMHGEADVVLSSASRTITMHSLYFGAGGEASSWLVTSADLRPFDHVTLRDTSTGAVIATGVANA